MEPQIWEIWRRCGLTEAKEKPRPGGRGFSGRDMPHNAEGGPDRSTNREVCGVTMTGARALCGFPRRQCSLGRSGIALDAVDRLSAQVGWPWRSR
jgi:hypothetical protein